MDKLCRKCRIRKNIKEFEKHNSHFCFDCSISETNVVNLQYALKNSKEENFRLKDYLRQFVKACMNKDKTGLKVAFDITMQDIFKNEKMN